MRHTLKASFEQQSDAQRLLDELLAAGYTDAVLAMSGATHAGRFTRQRPAVTLHVHSAPEASRALGIIERAKPARFQDDPDESVSEDAVRRDATTAGETGCGNLS